MKEGAMDQVSIKKVKGMAELVDIAKTIIMNAAKEAWEQGWPFLLGLSGGKTPVKLYQQLNKELVLDQKNFPVEFFLGDERNVPWDDSRSNYLLVKNNLLGGNEEGLKHLHDFRTDLDRLEAVRVYAEELAKLAPDGLDLAIIGLGKDGHFASIFPGFTQWENKELAVATETTENEVRERYSMSPKYLLNTKKILVLLAGDEKLSVLDKLADQNLTKEVFPAKLLLKHEDVQILFSVKET